MPYLRLQTNHPLSTTDAERLADRLSKQTARCLGKAEGYVMVAIEARPLAMAFAGDTSPCAYVELKSLGLPEDRTAEFSDAICRIIEDEIGVPGRRTYIEFSPAQRHLWGWDHRTF